MSLTNNLNTPTANKKSILEEIKFSKYFSKFESSQIPGKNLNGIPSTFLSKGLYKFYFNNQDKGKEIIKNFATEKFPEKNKMYLDNQNNFINDITKIKQYRVINKNPFNRTKSESIDENALFKPNNILEEHKNFKAKNKSLDFLKNHESVDKDLFALLKTDKLSKIKSKGKLIKNFKKITADNFLPELSNKENIDLLNKDNNFEKIDSQSNEATSIVIYKIKKKNKKLNEFLAMKSYLQKNLLTNINNPNPLILEGNELNKIQIRELNEKIKKDLILNDHIEELKYLPLEKDEKESFLVKNEQDIYSDKRIPVDNIIKINQRKLKENEINNNHQIKIKQLNYNNFSKELKLKIEVNNNQDKDFMSYLSGTGHRQISYNDNKEKISLTNNNNRNNMKNSENRINGCINQNIYSTCYASKNNTSPIEDEKSNSINVSNNMNYTNYSNKNSRNFEFEINKKRKNSDIFYSSQNTPNKKFNFSLKNQFDNLQNREKENIDKNLFIKGINNSDVEILNKIKNYRKINSKQKVLTILKKDILIQNLLNKKSSNKLTTVNVLPEDKLGFSADKNILNFKNNRRLNEVFLNIPENSKSKENFSDLELNNKYSISNLILNCRPINVDTTNKLPNTSHNQLNSAQNNLTKTPKKMSGILYSKNFQASIVKKKRTSKFSSREKNNINYSTSLNNEYDKISDKMEMSISTIEDHIVNKRNSIKSSSNFSSNNNSALKKSNIINFQSTSKKSSNKKSSSKVLKDDRKFIPLRLNADLNLFNFNNKESIKANEILGQKEDNVELINKISNISYIEIEKEYCCYNQPNDNEICTNKEMEMNVYDSVNQNQEKFNKQNNIEKENAQKLNEEVRIQKESSKKNSNFKKKTSSSNISATSISSISSNNVLYPMIKKKKNTLDRILTTSLNKQDDKLDIKKKIFLNNFNNSFIKKSIAENRSRVTENNFQTLKKTVFTHIK